MFLKLYSPDPPNNFFCGFSKFKDHSSLENDPARILRFCYIWFNFFKTEAFAWFSVVQKMVKNHLKSVFRSVAFITSIKYGNWVYQIVLNYKLHYNFIYQQNNENFTAVAKDYCTQTATVAFVNEMWPCYNLISSKAMHTLNVV